MLNIGSNNNLCLLPCGNCDYVSDYHATITFDDVCIIIIFY